jgi:DNA-binding SARP family transcriptional activator
MAGLEVRVLGPLEVFRDGVALDLGAPRQRALLVALVLRANQLVPIERLLDDLWGEDPPARARHSIHVYVANLRKLLESDAGYRAPSVLVTRPGGYMIVLAPANLDVALFEQRVAEGREHAARGEAEQAVRTMRDALSLWHADPITEFAYEDFAAGEVARLDELRIAMTEECLELELTLGRDAQLVGELDGLVRAHPLRERLWYLYMLALYRSGRQAEALRAYQQLRATLLDELGVEPSADLREMERAILEHAPSLDRAGRRTELDAQRPNARQQSDNPVYLELDQPAPRHRRRNMTRALAAVVIVAIAAAVAVVVGRPKAKGATSVTGSYTPRLEATRCPAAFLAAVPNGSCEDLIVPESRAHTGGRWIRLPLTRAPARSGGGASDPVIVVGDWSDTLEDAARSPARDHAELISLPTRLSQAPNHSMACPGVEPIRTASLQEPVNDRAEKANSRAAFSRCYRNAIASGVDVTQYNVETAASDVVDLIRAMHLRSVNLVADGGFQPEVFAVVRDVPAAVRSVTLQNPLAAGTAGITDETASLVRSFHQYSSLCGADPSCARAYPDLEEAMRRDVALADARPRVVKGQLNGREYLVRIDGARAARALAYALRYAPSLSGIPETIGAAYQQPTLTDVASSVLAFDYFDATPDFPWVSTLSGWCSYELYAIGPGRTRTQRTRPELAGVDEAGDLQSACRAWPVPRAPTVDFNSPVASVPTLIVEGSLDLFSRPEWVASLRSGLAHSSEIVLPTLGAYLMRDGVPPCLNDLRRQFLADPTALLDTAGCSRQSPAVNFVVPAT